MARTLKVVFRSDIRGIAQAGEVKVVSPGYARNYLFPRNLAFPATDAAMRQWDTERQGWISKAERLRQEAQEVAKRVEAVTLTITAKVSQEGKLFGSVGRTEIHEALIKQGITLDKRTLDHVAPIKQIGPLSVPVRLAGHVQAQLKIEVVAETLAHSD